MFNKEEIFLIKGDCGVIVMVYMMNCVQIVYEYGVEDFFEVYVFLFVMMIMMKRLIIIII